MEQPISIFNWSVNKVLQTEVNVLKRARIKILFVLIIFSLIKVFLVLPVLVTQHVGIFQLARAGILIGVYAVLLKLLLADKKYLVLVTHVMLWIGLFFIWTNIIVASHSINLITAQFIFMLILSSFYLLSRRLALVYIVLSILPAVLYLVFKQDIFISAGMGRDLGSPGFEIVAILNFITIVIAHYLFSNAFKATIAEKEALNLKLQEAVKSANRAADIKSDFLSTMSHELRTPLNSVLGISELLLSESKDKDQAEHLEILKFSAENLHSLINDILDYNKLDSGKLEMEAIPIDLAELMHNLSASLSYQAKQKSIGFYLNIDEEVYGKKVITDPTRLSQIIYNLAGNAVKFTDKGSVSIFLTVQGINDNSLKVRFKVADTGIGISSDKQEAIFEPFTQESIVTARKFGGTGLGLAIVKKLLEMFKSSIHLQSEPGAGSTFYFDILFKLHNTFEETKTEPADADFNLSGIKILVAEDNLMNRFLLSKALSKWNNTPDFVTNGKDAVEEINRNRYDIILLDLHMPELNGFEAAKAIRAIKDDGKANCYIIAVTASASENLDTELKNAGINDHLIKPFKISELYSKLKKAINSNSHI